MDNTSEDASEPRHHTVEELLEQWPTYVHAERLSAFKALTRSAAEDLFLSLGPVDQYELLEEVPNIERRSWIRLLAPDDTADLIQKFPEETRPQILQLLDTPTMREVIALLAYAEDDAGGLMNPRFIRIRPDVPIDVAIRYIRAQARSEIGTIHYVYVLDHAQKLMGAMSFRDLLLAPPDRFVSEIMKTDLIALPEDMDQEDVGRQFADSGLSALPVVDPEGRMKGIVTVDDAVEVVQEEATEDIHKLGGTAALQEPYLKTPLFKMIQKRSGWLTLLFIGEMFTATAMTYFEGEIEKATVLALFIPLIISSGGNSGSQATSLVIRSMSLKELRLKDWTRVLGRETLTGLLLGIILGAIGSVRILLWPNRTAVYGENYIYVAATVAISLIGVVLWGSLCGSMLPFMLRRFNLDPATASAPLVATLVDVTGLVIYFAVARIVLHGILL